MRHASIALLAGLTLASALASAEERHALTFILAGGLDGALAPARCDDGAPDGRHLGHLAASIAQARAGAESSGRTVAAVIHLGDLSGPAAIGRFLLSQPDGPARLAGFASHLGLTHAIIGNNLIDRGPRTIAALLRAYRDAGIPVLNATLQCEQRVDCTEIQALAPWTPIKADGLSIGLVGGTGGNVLTAVDPESTEGLRVSTGAFDEQARAAKAQGMALVVVASHWMGEPGAFAEETALARTLESADLLLLNQLSEVPSAHVAIMPDSGPAIAASGHAETEAIRVDVDGIVADGAFTITEIKTERVTAQGPDPTLNRQMIGLVRDYCSELGRPLPARAPHRVGHEEFLPFLLDEMRLASGGEVAVINTAAVERKALPFEGTISTADVFAALPYDNALVRAPVNGARLRALWKTSKASWPGRFAWIGIEERDGATWVNGRPLDDNAGYMLAATDFLARGGDGLATPPLTYKAVRSADSDLQLRDVVQHALSDADAGTRALAGDSALDLQSRLRWTWSYALGLSSQGTQRTATATGYSDTRLQRDPSLTVRAEATGRLDGDARDHAIRLTARGRYASARIASAPSTEVEDQAFAEALYRLRSIRHRLHDSAWAPVPYVGTTIDTEFVPSPSDASRRQELGGSVGLRWMAVRPLELKVGWSSRRARIAGTARVRNGVEAGYDLPRFSPIKLNGLPVDVESGFDLFVTDSGGVPQQEGRLRARVLLPLGGPLAVSAGIDAIGLKSGPLPFAFLTDASLGITARFDGARQRF